jgi:hypothetical protein
MEMLLVCSLFSLAFASDGIVLDDSEACTEANGHPETGGFYVVGFGYQDVMAHEDPDDPSTYGEMAQPADDTLWTANPETPYPDARPKECTPSMWTDCSYFSDQYKFLYLHTCSKMRFSYPADSGSTVYKMKDNATFQACDFTDAVLIEEHPDPLPSGAKYTDYPLDYDTFEVQHFFASLDGCEQGQKVAIMPFSEYTSTYDMCSSMGTTSSRIQHCDCDHSIRPTTLNEICLTGFVDGCMLMMPHDHSCCPDPAVATSPSMGTYVNGGNCIPLSEEEDMITLAKLIYDTCTDTANQAECDGYKAGDCPWESVPGASYHSPPIMNTMDDSIDGADTVFNPVCNSWYMIAHCADLANGNTVGAGFSGDTLAQIQADITADLCGQNQHVAAYAMYTADAEGMDARLSAAQWVALNPTPAPTFAPTPLPTPEPTTPAPTFAPTPAPTSAPTAASTTEEPEETVEASFTALAAIGLTLSVLV